MIVLIIYITLMAIVLLAWIKNEVTFRCRSTVSIAIYRYAMDQIRKGIFVYQVNYKDMEPYHKTLFRFWDWGYKNILPPDKFEIIKPYI